VPPKTALLPTLKIALLPPNQVRISWLTSYPCFTLQYANSLFGPWATLGLPVSIVGGEFVVFDTVGPTSKFYRLIKQ